MTTLNVTFYLVAKFEYSYPSYHSIQFKTILILVCGQKVRTLCHKSTSDAVVHM
jgi:hypothetical protein